MTFGVSITDKARLLSILQDYDGPEDDEDAGLQYFRKRFVRLTQKANKMLEKKKTVHGDRDPVHPYNARQVYTQ